MFSSSSKTKKGSLVASKRKFTDLISVDEPFQDTQKEVPTQVDEEENCWDQDYTEDLEDNNNQSEEEEDEESSEDDVDEDDEEVNKDLRAAFPSKVPTSGKLLPSKLKETATPIPVPAPAPSRIPPSVPAAKKVLVELDEDSEDAKDDDVDVDLVGEEQEVPKKNSSSASSSSKENFTFEFQQERFRNIWKEEKGGLANEIKAMYSSFISKREHRKSREYTDHPLVKNLEMLVHLLAYEMMQTQDGQLDAREKADVIIANAKLILETLPMQTKWQNDLFIHFREENENKKVGDPNANFLWPYSFQDHMIESVLSPKIQGNVSAEEKAKLLTGKGESNLRAIAEARKEMNIASSYYPDHPVSGKSKDKILFEVRAFLWVQWKRKTVRTNIQKRRSDQRKVKGDMEKGKRKKKQNSDLTDDIDEEVANSWHKLWVEERNLRFDESWFPRFWLFFVSKGKPASPKDRAISASQKVSEMQISDSCSSRAVRRKNEQLQALKIDATYNRDAGIMEELEEDEFLQDYKSPQGRGRSGSGS